MERIGGIEPNYLCQPCARLVEQINKEFRSDQKYKKENYSDDENIKEKVKETENKNYRYRVKGKFKQHGETDCRIFENTSHQSEKTYTIQTWKMSTNLPERYF